MKDDDGDVHDDGVDIDGGDVYDYEVEVDSGMNDDKDVDDGGDDLHLGLLPVLGAKPSPRLRL